MVYGSIADWLTAIATLALAVAAWVQLPIVARQLSALSEQIKLTREAEANAARRLREWETLKACQIYDSDPTLDEATKRIWIASCKGTNYASASVDTRDMICLLNYLDGLSIGIEQELYIEKVVKDHLGPVFNHAVTDFVESGLVNKDGLESLMRVHAKWFRVPHKPSYTSP